MIETIQDTTAPRGDSADLSEALWKVSVKLHGISELFKNQDEDHTVTKVGALGMGMFLADLASEIDCIQDALIAEKEPNKAVHRTIKNDHKTGCSHVTIQNRF